ncbi:hypothetical protein ACJMK2_039228 [Sinanodonta woodiana]|uniref:VWFD domain-containing protein n=1 Tax=Sinanodonta woodiana TaxID=1069815 RepID=A0ABD3WBD7_SINWO
MLEQPKDKLSDLQLTEDIFNNEMKQTLGVEISCVVLALSGPNGIPGIRSDRSDAFFAGIRVNVVKPVIVRGDDKEQGLVTLTSTIPIGCIGKTGCSLPIRAHVPDEYKCKGPSFGNNCGTSIFSSKWNNSHNIVITAADTVEYSMQGTFLIYLKTARFWTSPRIWDNYYLPNFQVEIVDSPKKEWRGKVCSSNNDLHMRTFDGRSFENHNQGEYILYRHLFYKAEVQMKIRSCGLGHVHCQCGVAVKAGLDVFVVDLCETIPFVGYKDGLCVESALDVRRNGNTYTIFLLYGTYVTFSLSPGYTNFNIAITSSVHDQSAKSTALCGALTGDDCTDDFRMRDGSWLITGVNLPCHSNPLIQPHDSFLNEWRVRPNESLFDLSQDVKDNLSPWVTYVCVCGNKSEQIADAPIPCGGHTTQECHLGSKVGTRACSIINTRRRRSISTKDRFPAPTDRIRRSATYRQEESIHMTEEEALTYCQDYMNKSQIYSLCLNVPSTHPEKNVETCVMDILLTNTTVWSESSRESMREQCLNEISRNNTFREVEEASGIVVEIQKKACPSMCSNRGHCVNGACICDHGYGASDCFTNLHEPPDMIGLLDNGLCDERHVECDQAFVYGETFVEGENLTCRIKSFTMSNQGDKTFEKTDYVPAEHETLFEVVCPVQKTRRKKRFLPKNIQASDRFVIGYTISVSNDGLNYGKDFDLYMYNSECQLPENISTTITFGLQDGYCFIDHACIIRGTISEKDECLICDDTQSDFQWSTRENHAGCRNIPETSLTTLSPKGSSTNLKINFAFLFVSTLALKIIFQS